MNEQITTSDPVKALCPFCGKEVDLKDPDTLYPSGPYWREEEGIHHYIRHKDCKEADNKRWGMHCPEVSGGCGLRIEADSKGRSSTKMEHKSCMNEIS